MVAGLAALPWCAACLRRAALVCAEGTGGVSAGVCAWVCVVCVCVYARVCVCSAARVRTQGDGGVGGACAVVLPGVARSFARADGAGGVGEGVWCAGMMHMPVRVCILVRVRLLVQGGGGEPV